MSSRACAHPYPPRSIPRYDEDQWAVPITWPGYGDPGVLHGLDGDPLISLKHDRGALGTEPSTTTPVIRCPVSSLRLLPDALVRGAKKRIANLTHSRRLGLRQLFGSVKWQQFRANMPARR